MSLRKLIALFLALWLPLANAGVAAMTARGDHDFPESVSALAAHDHDPGAVERAAHVDAGTTDHSHGEDGAAGTAHQPGQSEHCDLCLSFSFGTPPARTLASATTRRGAGPSLPRADFASAFLETPRRPPLS